MIEVSLQRVINTLAAGRCYACGWPLGSCAPFNCAMRYRDDTQHLSEREGWRERAEEMNKVLGWAVGESTERLPTEARRIVTVEMMQAGVHEFKDFANRLETGMSLERALVKVYEVMRALEAPVSPLAPSQEKPTVRLCGCPGVCQGYETLSKGVVCSMHVPESIVRGPQHVEGEKHG